ncbi:glycosyltransferase family 4 protein [Bradyrhizobium niftali]|uniref:Glycosyltransferase family 1 protein n=1 Tax=Bradyrhizobium niftali TaxID=2560055 RepID=A0A4Y9LYQ8_9BRAD|nr:glycosyltransferase family 4 protein [Bradyrhizobium niftali]TFV47993.1 glycosyltransferase family 1 protein [Bradyrhizobium niftali]
MRILEMNYEFPPVGGGGGKATEDLAAELSKLGHSIRVLTARQGNLPRLETSAGFEIERIFAFRRQRDRCSVWEMIGFILMAVPAGLRTVRTFRPDAIHVHFAVPTGFAAWLVAKLSGTPYVLTAHLGDVPGGTPEQTDKFFRLIKPLTRPIWHGAAAVTAVSSFVARLARDAYGLEALVIPNGVDVGKSPAAARPPGRTIKLIFAGRMVAQKNLAWGLKRLAAVKDRNWTLDLFGDGPSRTELERHCEALGLSDRVAFHGWVAPEEVDVAMSRSDILFMPSLSEGLSLVAVNALAHGLALACSRIDGFADVLVENENGLSAPLDDPEGFERALARMLDDRDQLLRMKLASSAKATSFDRRAIAARYEQVLRSASSKLSQRRK